MSPRALAKKNGDRFYISLNPCKRGHLVKRITATGTCTECRKVMSRIRFHADPEKTKAITKRKYDANAERIRARRMEYYEKNKEIEKQKSKIRSREWRKLNPDHLNTHVLKNAQSAIDRARKANRLPNWLTPIDFWMMEEACHIRILRERATGLRWDVDHIIPFNGKIVSGLHVPANLQVIPRKLNRQKHNHFEGT